MALTKKSKYLKLVASDLTFIETIDLLSKFKTINGATAKH